jgi:hypothetical protein
MQRAAMARMLANNLAAKRLGLFDLTRVELRPSRDKPVVDALVPERFSGGNIGDRDNPFRDSLEQLH